MLGAAGLEAAGAPGRSEGAASSTCLRERGGPGRAGPGAAPTLQPSPLLPWRSSTTKVMRLSILADLHVEMNPEGNLELVTSACKPTVEEMQSTEELERSTPRFFLGIRVTEGERRHQGTSTSGQMWLPALKACRG